MSQSPAGLTPPSDWSVEDLLDDAERVGGVFSTGYEECDILTNDYWTQQAGGLPKHSLLIAKPLLEGPGLVNDEEVSTRHQLPSESGDDLEDTLEGDASHALLLRVKGPANLPNEGQQTSNRHDAIRQAITSGSGPAPSEADFVDALTRRELQYSGVEASVLGTFYYTTEDGEEKLTFGSDVQTFFSAGHYVVYKPSASALSWIGSYPASGSESPIHLGDVKYTTTRIFEQDADAPVFIDIDDFIRSKTAVFGMTRKGKSNTMKIIAAAIAESENEVGQLIFDPSGEYAYTNDQDECALGELYDGDDSISTVYKFDPDDEEEGVKPIRCNLLNRDNLNVVKSYVRNILLDESAQYVENFLNTVIPSDADLEEMEGGEYQKAKRVQSAYYAVISKALSEEKLPDDFNSFWLGVNDEVLKEINEEADLPHQKASSGKVALGQYRGSNQLVDFWESVAASDSDIVEDWVHDDLQNILEMFNTDGQAGYNKLIRLNNFHNADSDSDVAEEAYQLLTDGELVVIDISNGREEIVTNETDRLVNYIRHQSRQRFRKVDEDDEDLPYLQIYLEEAHRHFDTETFRTEGSMNPYVELAKEGAKFNVGMTYATQEVSSIDERVLANTANWIVTHLNSDKELRELSDYYNFEDFKHSIKNVEEKGFVRLKTRSGEYIVPLKVALFNRDWVTTHTDFDVEKRDQDLDDDQE